MNHWMDVQAAAGLEYGAQLRREAARDRRAAADRDTRAFDAVRRLIVAAVRFGADSRDGRDWQPTSGPGSSRIHTYPGARRAA